MRYAESLRIINKISSGRSIVGLDFGCGYHGQFVRMANRILNVQFYGFDLAVSPNRKELLAGDIAVLREANIRPEVVTLHAVLEHLESPVELLDFLLQLMSDDAVLMLTVPSKTAKPVLEFLAYRLGVIARSEIEDHKCYYDRASLMELLRGRFERVEHRYFQWGFNNRITAYRKAKKSDE